MCQPKSRDICQHPERLKGKPGECAPEQTAECHGKTEEHPSQPTKEVLMREKVEEVLDMIRPSLAADGGNVELVDVNDGVVKLKLTGACAGCPMSTMTLKNGIERILKQEIPEVKEVVSA